MISFRKQVESCLDKVSCERHAHIRAYKLMIRMVRGKRQIVNGRNYKDTYL